MNSNSEDQAHGLQALVRWAPSVLELQRGRSALLREMARPKNLPLPVFAHRAHKRTQQIYADLAAKPARLLALTVGKRLRLPDWQLNPESLLLTQMLLRNAKGVDTWTIYTALSQPSEAFGGRSPVDAVTHRNVGKVTAAMLDHLGVH